VTYEFRTAEQSDWDDIAHILSDAFNEDFDQGEMDLEGSVFEPSRTVVATSDGAIVGVASAFTRDLAVPGATVPASHVTMVSVGATHRRQGLLTRMITDLHTDAAARDEPIAVLWASEGRIYQRYGYGLAARKAEIGGRTSEIPWLTPFVDPGRLRAVPADSTDVFRAVYEAVWTDRPGHSNRDDLWWGYVLGDLTTSRRGATAQRAVVHEDAAGTVDGYLLWRVKGDWANGGPDGTVRIKEIIATTPDAYRALWQFAFSVDLTRNFSFSYAAVDEPLQYLVSEPRRLQMKVSDALWVRVLDVPKALEARRYAAPIDVVISVLDDRTSANNGSWHLIGSLDKAVCTTTEAPADLAMSIGALGAAYLGGTSLATLAAGGRVQELRPGALAAASAGFGWHREPAAIETF